MTKWFLSILLSIFLTLTPAYGALGDGIIWDVWHAGSNNNGGGFDSAGSSCGTDYSKQSAAQIVYSDLLIGSNSLQFTSSLNPVTSLITCNVFQILSGSGCTTGYFKVISVSGTTATVDRSLGSTSSTCGANLGGALGTPALLASIMTGNQQGWIKSDATYSIPRINIGFTSGGNASINGYTSTYGDGGMPTLQMTSGDYMIYLGTGNFNFGFNNFILDKANTGGGDVLYFGNCCETATNISVINVGGNNGINMNSDRDACIKCYVTGVSGAGVPFVFNGSTKCYLCVGYLNTTTSDIFIFQVPGGGAGWESCDMCMALNNTSSANAFYINSSESSPVSIVNSVAVNNGGDGIRIDGTGDEFPIFLMNNILALNTGYGINAPSQVLNLHGQFQDCNAFYSNTTGDVNNLQHGLHDVTLTANPFVSSVTDNVQLNTTSGGGAALRAASCIGALLVGGTNYGDIGALQHQDPVATPPQIVVPIE